MSAGFVATGGLLLLAISLGGRSGVSTIVLLIPKVLLGLQTVEVGRRTSHSAIIGTPRLAIEALFACPGCILIAEVLHPGSLHRARVVVGVNVRDLENQLTAWTFYKALAPRRRRPLRIAIAGEGFCTSNVSQRSLAGRSPHIWGIVASRVLC